jgi:hypothetical protein
MDWSLPKYILMYLGRDRFCTNIPEDQCFLSKAITLYPCGIQSHDP